MKPPFSLIAISAMSSIPPLDQPLVLVCRKLELLDRPLDRALLVGRIHDADQLSRRTLEVIDGSGTGRLFGR